MELTQLADWHNQIAENVAERLQSTQQLIASYREGSRSEPGLAASAARFEPVAEALRSELDFHQRAGLALRHAIKAPEAE